MPKSSNTHVFEVTLDGFINVYEDSGKYNNRTFSFVIPKEKLEQLESDRDELMEWKKTSAPNPRSVREEPPKWDEDGLIKYSYGAGDGERKPVPPPVWVDSTGQPLKGEALKAMRGGTKVKVIIQQSPYLFGKKVGTKFRIPGVQVIELATGNGAIDSGTLSVEEVAAVFGTTEGFDSNAPAVQKAETASGGGEAYDF